MKPPEKAPARVGSGKGLIDLTEHAENATKPAKEQGNNSPAFAPQGSKICTGIRPNFGEVHDGLGEDDDIIIVDDDIDDLVEDDDIEDDKENSVNDTLLDAEISYLRITSEKMFAEGTITIREFIQGTKDGDFKDGVKNVRKVLKECKGVLHGF